jgi:hypothetical protein
MELQQNTSRITWDGGAALKNREAQSFRRCISAMLWGDQHLTQIEPITATLPIQESPELT